MSPKPKRRGLGDVLFGRNRGKVLGLLLGNPDRSYYLREIAAAIGTKPGTIAPELALLDRLGLLVSKRIGNQLFYRADQESPIFKELQALVAKTGGIFQLLGSALEKLSSRIDCAFVFGSFARQEETTHSDVDLLVIGRVELDDVLAQLQSVEKQIQRPINPTVYSPEDFSAKVGGGSHFVTAILRGAKVFIVGDENELRRVSRQQPSEARTTNG
jgi:predicted nucleotidyltransferase